MNPRRRSLAAVAALSATLVAATPAAAADRTAELSAEKASFSITTPVRSGFVYTSDVSDSTPRCTAVIFACDTTLVEVKEDAQKLVFTTTGTASQTFTDVDLFVYRSDAAGTMGAELGSSVTATLDETVSVSAARAKAGFYLVQVDWYFGSGAATVTGAFTPKPEPVPAG